MYAPFRDEPTPLQLNIPWDKFTATGFVIALVITFTLLLLVPIFRITPAQPRDININTIPMIEMLSFGDGDGTGVSKGNLTKEGKKFKGKKPSTNLSDAEIAMKTRTAKDVSNTDLSNARDVIPVNELNAKNSNNKSDRGNSTRDIGDPDGDPFGSGLGGKGTGKGSGLGFGDIEWGGGGNRVVLFKKLPEYPDGLNTTARIKIRFTVASNGRVMDMMPAQKGDPVLERAAMNALKQWRFNTLDENKDMIGIITFTFRVS